MALITRAQVIQLKRLLSAAENTDAAGVGTAEIVDLAVTTAKIAAKAVTAAKLADAVTASLAKADSAVQPAALENYMLSVAAGQKMLRNTLSVTGTSTVDLSASFATIDEVVAVLGVAPSADAYTVAIVIPEQTGADAGKFTIKVAKLDGSESTTATAIHFIGFGTPVTEP